MTISRNLSFLAEGVSSTGVLGATYGGTGQSSITTGDLLYGSASNTISKLAIGSTGTILRVVAGVPSWGTDYTGTVTSVAASVPSFLSISGSPITTSGTLAITYSGTALPVANGGSGLTSLTAGYIPYGNGTSAFNSSASLTFNGTTLTVGANQAITAGNYLSFVNATPTTIAYIGNGILITGGSTSDLAFRTDSGKIQWATSGTAASPVMTLDSSGNLGLGVIPSAWYSASKAIQIGTTSSIENSNGTLIGYNNYRNSSGVETYLTSSYSSLYYQNSSGQFVWYTAPSGTAGNAITFTQAMTLFNTGGVSIGNTTDPGAGNLRFNTTGTNGIYFGSSSILTDYETGTWTPAQGGGLTVVGTFSSTGKYTKIGNLVFVVGTLSATTSLACGNGGAVIINNLPFYSATSGTGNTINGTITTVSTLVSSATNVYSNAITATTIVYFSLSYTV